MLTINSKLFSKSNIINLLLLIIPISYIAGNLIINLNIILLIIFAFLFYKKKLFKFEFYLVDKLIIIFFLYIFLLGLANTFYSYYFGNDPSNFSVLIKSILYLRFLLLYIILRYFIENNLIDLKIFFISCLVCTFFVCFDLIYQFNFGKDIFGYVGDPRRLSGPFGDEQISGSYLQRFSVFSLFLIPAIMKNKNKKLIFLSTLSTLVLILASMIIAGNRMPVALFLLMMFLYLLVEKDFRKYFLPLLVIVCTIFFLFVNFNSNFKNHYGSFYTKLFQFKYLLNFEEVRDQNIIQNTYIKEFYSGYKTWSANKYFGGGVKSFKINCPKNFNNCAPHPHNYYLEILADLGLFGFLILAFVFFVIIFESFFKRFFLQEKFANGNLIDPFILLFIAEIFPLKSSGSFFTTGNATFIFLVLSLSVALSRKKI